MNFFQSVFSDDPNPSTPQSPPESPENPTPTIPSITSAWTFGSTLIKTLATKSESVIDTYRHDLHEFTSGIKRETAVIREAAVKALPTSLEFAQESLESIGQSIDDLGSTVTDIIHHGKESILAVDYSDTDCNNNNTVDLPLLKPYSRLDAQIRTVQSDMNTYLKDPDLDLDPEDVNEFNEWKLGFKFDEKVEEIEDVMNGVVGEIYREIVPLRVDEKVFWVRYFYKVYKIKKAEEARVKLVKRAVSGEEDEEELSWDVDEDDYQENNESVEKDEILEKKGLKVENLEGKSGLKTASEGRTDKDSDFSVVSSQPSPDEDGSWDEVEDIGGNDENKDKVVSCGSHGSVDRVELRKRLSVAEEEEDLTWDIEDEEAVNA